MAKRNTATATAPVAATDADSLGEAPGTFIGEGDGATPPESTPAAVPAAPEGHVQPDEHEDGSVTITLTFPATGRTLASSDDHFKVDVTSVAPAGLVYLMHLGFTTSLTQCISGDRKAYAESGVKDEATGEMRAYTESEIVTMLRETQNERLDRICAGTVGAGGGKRSAAAQVPLDEALLANFAHMDLLMTAARLGVKAPPAATSKQGKEAIAKHLADPGVRARLVQQVKAITEATGAAPTA